MDTIRELARDLQMSTSDTERALRIIMRVSNHLELSMRSESYDTLPLPLKAHVITCVQRNVLDALTKTFRKPAKPSSIGDLV